MVESKFLLVSLEETKAKHLAQIVSNDTCRKILDHLSSSEATETALSQKLGIPLSTVHYNLKQLIEGGLVSVDEFHYSEKGKEVNHYRIANKYIIIAPKTTESLARKLRKILPVFAFVSVAGFIAEYLYRSTLPFTAAQEARNIADGAAATIASDAASLPLARDAAAPVAEAIAKAPAGQVAAAGIHVPDIALWVAVGAFVALLLYLLIDIKK